MTSKFSLISLIQFKNIITKKLTILTIKKFESTFNNIQKLIYGKILKQMENFNK